MYDISCVFLFVYLFFGLFSLSYSMYTSNLVAVFLYICKFGVRNAADKIVVLVTRITVWTLPRC